ncbi:SPT8-like protein [Naviculisporaceae sp. PSN 640]
MDDDEREYGSSDNEQDELIEDADDVEADNDADEDNEEEEDEQEPDPDQDEPEQEEAEAEPETETGPDGQPTTSDATAGQRSRHVSAAPSTASGAGPWRPKLRQEYLDAALYDIVPTMAAPMSTSVNALAITPDLRYWLTGGSDGYIRKIDGVATINGKTPLTVAQRHPYVDSVTKAGVLVSYWENDEPAGPGARPEDRILSPVYSLAVHSGALWLLSGLESGGINLQSVRHDEGKKIHCLREGGHSNAVSVLQLAPDEKSVLSGSWDKTVLDWDLNNGQVIRSYEGSGGQISAIELRPAMGSAIPAEASEPEIKSDTFETNEGRTIGSFFANNQSDSSNTVGRTMDDVGGNGTNDAPSPEHESLFGSPAGSLFGDTDNMGGGNAFGNDDDDGFMDMDGSTHHGLEHPGEFPMGDADEPEPMAGVTPPSTAEQTQQPPPSSFQTDQQQPPSSSSDPNANPQATPSSPSMVLKSSHPQSHLSPSQTSSSTFFSAAIDGTIRIWDRRVPDPVARIGNRRGVPPWCMGACWSPSGDFIYAGRRNGTVEEFSIHHAKANWQPERVLKFPNGSGAVSCVRPMANGRHLVCASHDILRLYDLKDNAAFKHSKVPFIIIPGPPRAGVISSLYIDPTSRIMVSAHGTRGWDGTSTEGIIGYEIAVAKG